MIEQTFTIINKLGLHARAAAKLVTTTSQFEADIQITKGERTVNGKSIMGLMMLAAAKGTEITVCADGDDAQQAIQSIELLINDYFEEGE